MSDETNDGLVTSLQSNEVSQEALEVSTVESASEVNEATCIEALSRSFEDYVRNYQDTWQQAWQESIAIYEQDVANWQKIISDFQNAGPQPSGNVPPAPTSVKPSTPAAPTAKPKPQKSGN
ncbi:hypothetical protein [Magnetovibrio sp.]|uniref:hypothetical protein n=1 Tax=Magnetovibrio sp. TaxID=2024836 RepID=UPI002F958671